MALPLLANIDVDDLERGVAFYCTALGLRVARRLSSIGAVELAGASAPIYLLEKAAGSNAASGLGQRRDYRRHWTPVHLDFVVEDITAAVERACGAGARLEQEVSTDVWGHLALLADPFGHGFCLIQFVGRGYDELAV
jgi:predicted enzyme related to lactoylglutathione lyase